MIFVSYLILVSLVSGLGIFTISTFFRQAFNHDQEIDNFNAIFWFGIAIVLAVVVLACLVFIGLELKQI